MAELGVPAALLRMRAAVIDYLRALDRPVRGRARRQALPRSRMGWQRFRRRCGLRRRCAGRWAVFVRLW